MTKKIIIALMALCSVQTIVNASEPVGGGSSADASANTSLNYFEALARINIDVDDVDHNAEAVGKDADLLKAIGLRVDDADAINSLLFIPEGLRGKTVERACMVLQGLRVSNDVKYGLLRVLPNLPTLSIETLKELTQTHGGIFASFRYLQVVSLEYGGTPFVLNEQQFLAALKEAAAQQPVFNSLNRLICKIAKAYKVSSFKSAENENYHDRSYNRETIATCRYFKMLADLGCDYLARLASTYYLTRSSESASDMLEQVTRIAALDLES